MFVGLQTSDLLKPLASSTSIWVTAIAIDYVDPECWMVGCKLLSDQGKNSLYFDIKIAD